MRPRHGPARDSLSLVPRVCKPYSGAQRRAGDCTAARTLPRPYTPAGARVSATPDLVHSLMHTEDGQHRRCMPRLHCPASADSTLRLRQRSRPPIVPRTRQQAGAPAEPRRDAPGRWRGTGHRSPGTPPWRGGLHARMVYRIRVWVRSGHINACMRCMRVICTTCTSAVRRHTPVLHPSCTPPTSPKRGSRASTAPFFSSRTFIVSYAGPLPRPPRTSAAAELMFPAPLLGRTTELP